MKSIPMFAIAACAAFFAPLGAQTPAAPAAERKPPLLSQIFDWNKLEVVQIPNGERRHVFDGPTTTVDQVHCHVTSLAPGQVSGEPRLHLQEEIIIIKEGEVEVTLDGTTQNVGAGSVIFFASRAITRLRNIGDRPATYYVIYYYTPKTPTE